jgi:hypothetical protein
MTMNSMTLKRPRALQLALPIWATVSLLLALLPSGVGGLARAVNAVLFLTMGPGCAVAGLLARRLPPAVVGVVAVATSLTVLLLSSQMLLIVGMWAPWRVAALVALATIGPVVVQIRASREVNP